MKRIIAILTLTLMLVLPAKAQIYVQEDEQPGRLQTGDPQVFVDMPGNMGTAVDWYTPVGDGILLLAALGGAYLLRKHGKDRNF